MPAYTVIAVADQVRDWQSTRGGPMKSYRVTLRNSRGAEMENVEWARKATSPKPEVGQSIIDADIDTTGQHGPKLKLAQQAGGGFGRSKPPEERRSIAMQHAQKCAVTILEVAGGHSAREPVPIDNVAKRVETIAWVLFRQVLASETQDRASA